jgi:hypothetical protein
VNDYGGLNTLWSDWVLPRFSPGGAVCPWTGDSWDAAVLADEVAQLGARLTALGITGLAEIGADESRIIAAAAPFPTRFTSGSLDAVGWALVRGAGVTRDRDAARVWFEAAEALGDAAAPLNLSRLADDPDEARRLARVAVARGNPWAADHLSHLDAGPATATATEPARAARAGA